ncbi:MAG: hypothetical protein HY327_05260 [Chloroflexi bacterium]|nr:hypothetical protein [Chloroflexota bacterium]
MKKRDPQKNNLRLRPRPSAPVSIRILQDALASLSQVAVSREMSVEALIKFYVGRGLRQDLSDRFDPHQHEGARSTSEPVLRNA